MEMFLVKSTNQYDKYLVKFKEYLKISSNFTFLKSLQKKQVD